MKVNMKKKVDPSIIDEIKETPLELGESAIYATLGSLDIEDLNTPDKFLKWKSEESLK